MRQCLINKLKKLLNKFRQAGSSLNSFQPKSSNEKSVQNEYCLLFLVLFTIYFGSILCIFFLFVETEPLSSKAYNRYCEFTIDRINLQY